ncbi:MAG: hypothetical protein ACUZ8I_12245 [Candidatus Scalindua sp.]
MTWNRKELENDIENLFGKEQLELLSPCLETIKEKKFNATYHLNEVERLINEELKRIAPDNHKLISLIDDTGEEGEKVLLVYRNARAHIIACLQSLHSIADVLAHVIYFALNMDNDDVTRVDSTRRYASTVSGKLNSISGANTLKIVFDSLIKDDEFVYLSAVVNCSKHRTLIKTWFRINLDLNKEYNANIFEFYAFEFNGRNYNQRRVIEFIKNEYSRIDSFVNEISIEINNFVRNKLKEQSDL